VRKRGLRIRKTAIKIKKIKTDRGDSAERMDSQQRRGENELPGDAKFGGSHRRASREWESKASTTKYKIGKMTCRGVCGETKHNSGKGSELRENRTQEDADSEGGLNRRR